MNRSILTLPVSFIFLLIFALPAQAKEQTLRLQLLDGNNFDVGMARDRPIYLKFWATWCGQCRKQMPHLSAIYEKYGDRLDVIAVNPGWNETHELVQKFQQEFKLKVPIALEPLAEVARAFNISVVPYSVLINKKGQIVHKAFGVSGNLDEKIEQLVRGDL